ncbi:c-type cytochrome biogenesis protein CcmI [Pseudosulfitobacter koreensis]|uniref:C-type cytochrome biogenesis protein CcmI n=1 Tax=Pseudosulfitobacter koreensis TaxID=2968472 RepID=A0ABT1YXW9_9RHOB|nr:c-type cytochrome biogenesis protein CcmI [Pseudosulfitobacter koreense]MCR8825734.1 c-type cytochrome biogenesis protein CcmI [Pseudosulfitobacter koreense]
MDIWGFGIIAAALVLVVSALLAAALRAGRMQARSAASYDVQVYRDQLAEVERDLARGTIAPEDAARVRTEVSRRILTADADARAPALRGGGRGGVVLAAVLTVALLAGSGVLYWQLGALGYGDLALETRIEMAAERRADRPTQAQAEAAQPGPGTSEDANSEYAALIDQLRAAVAQRPDDLQGHVLLAQTEARLGNFAKAAAAQEVVLRLKGDAAGVADLTTQAELLIFAAGGYVSPQAEDALRRALNIDDTDPSARFYWGEMLIQTGRPDLGFRIWDGLLRAGPEGAPWMAPIRARMPELAELAGVNNYSMPQPDAPRGPSQQDIENAAGMSPQERMQMIEGMVASLSDRLGAEGGPVSDWAQLITALAVLGRQDDARAVLDNARATFNDDPTALDVLSRAAEQAVLE